jgi:hypothetical protein
MEVIAEQQDLSDQISDAIGRPAADMFDDVNELFILSNLFLSF